MIYMFLANGFEEVEALCPLDLLRRAGLQVTTVGVGGETVIGAHGIAVQADIPEAMFRDNNPEMVILPGGMPGTKHLDASRTVETALHVAAAKGGYLAAICAAPLVLGKRGYLIGKNATCYPGFEAHLEGAKLPGKRVCVDGNVITGAGMGAALDFSLALTAVLFGEEKATALRSAVIAD